MLTFIFFKSLFGDSDDDDDIQKTPKTAQAVTPRAAVDDDSDGLFDSDAEEEVQPAKKLKTDEGAKSRLVKGSRPITDRKAPAVSENFVDSDEYDSGDEVKRTAEDDNFIDSDDDADVMEEYKQEQRFDDERPTKKQKHKEDNRAVREVEDQNPMSQTLSTMKKRKSEEWGEEMKAELAQELLAQMDRAAAEDDEAFQKGAPAISKLKSLQHVQKMVGIKVLQPTLLEYDLLSVLKRWIEPKDTATLTSMQVRTAVYDMLRKLPCEVVHLRRSGVGKTVMALLRHKAEVDQNKQILGEIIEKWNRMVFNKSAAMRSRAPIRASAPEVGTASGDIHSAGRVKDQQGASAASAAERRGFTEILQTKQSTASNGFDRVRVPYSAGFMFSVQPQSKVNKKAVQAAMRENSGGTRDVLMKSMRDMSGSGKKQAFRAVEASLTGRKG